MTPKEVKLATQIGRIGTATRGFVFALVGVLLFQAGLQSNPSQGIGIDSALTALLHQPYGIWLLGIVGIGLIAFGVYSILSAAWFRMKR
jgi:ABC-type dipeptide/oligopeptide/nickel transport system permease component